MATQSFVLHEIHCQRNFYRCECGEFLKKSEKVEHEAAVHKSEQCLHCRLTAPAYEMAKHKCQKLPKSCQFCNAVIIFDDYVEHVKVCGSRTQQCPICKKYIQAWVYEKHEDTCVPEPEPVRPQRPNRFMEQERQAKEKARQEDAKISPIRGGYQPERPKAQPVPAKRPTESTGSSVKLTPPVTAAKPSIPSRSGIAAKPAAKPAAPVKPGKAPNPTAAVSAQRTESKPGPRTHDSHPLPKKQPDPRPMVPSDDYDFEHMTEVKDRKPRYIEDDDDIGQDYDASPPANQPHSSSLDEEDEAIARAYEESLREAPGSIPRPKPRSPDDDEDEAMARALAMSMQETAPTAVPTRAKPRATERDEEEAYPPRQPATGMDTMGRYDADFARAVQESLQGDETNTDWVLGEDLGLNEAILKSMREK